MDRAEILARLEKLEKEAAELRRQLTGEVSYSEEDAEHGRELARQLTGKIRSDGDGRSE